MEDALKHHSKGKEFLHALKRCFQIIPYTRINLSKLLKHSLFSQKVLKKKDLDKNEFIINSKQKPWAPREIFGSLKYTTLGSGYPLFQADPKETLTSIKEDLRKVPENDINLQSKESSDISVESSEEEECTIEEKPNVMNTILLNLQTLNVGF